MAPPACFIRPDLSSVALIDAEGSDTWHPGDDGDAVDAQACIRRAREGAAWVARHKRVRRRLGLLCIDVQDTVCTCLRTASRNPQVLGAAFRNLVSEWGDATPGGSVVALDAGHEQGPARDAGEVTTPVLAAPDALARLFLDALDRDAIRAANVVTLWHAMSIAWAADGQRADELVCVVLRRAADHVVWSWQRAGRLVAAGTTTAPDADAGEHEPEHTAPADAVAQRLSLDWLTWSAQLGVTPDRLVLVAPDPAPLRDAILRRRSDFQVQEIIEPDPVQAAVSIAGERMAQDPSVSQACAAALPSLSHRPGRAVRKRYQLTAAAIVLLGVAFVGLGYRLDRSARAWRDGARAIDAEARAHVGALGDLPISPGGPLLTQLEQVLAELRSQPDIRPPAAPKPIFDELALVLETLSEEKYEGGQLQSIVFDAEKGPQFSVVLLDRETIIELEGELQASDKAHAQWRKDPRASGGNQRATFNATWKPEEGASS